MLRGAPTYVPNDNATDIKNKGTVAAVPRLWICGASP